VGRVHRPISGRNGAFIAQSVSTRLKYTESFTVAGALGAMTNQVFRLNSLYDPDFTGGGHQPMGFDQLAGLYNRYRVDKVNVRCTFHKNSEAQVTGIALRASNATTNISTPFSALQEQQFVKWSTLSASTAGSKTQVTLRGTYLPHMIAGVTPAKYKIDDTFSALATDNPSEIIVLHVSTADVMASTAHSTIFTLEMDFYATFYDPHLVAQS